MDLLVQVLPFALMESGLFNELVLIDVNKEKAEGEAMDISHGLPYVRRMDIYAGDYSDCKDAGIIIITAGAGQKPGETRLDLVNKNVAIFKSIIPEIVKYNKDAILLVVSNPVDILTYVTLKLSGFPKNRVIGSGTVLDSARLKYLLGKHLDVNPKSVAVLYYSANVKDIKKLREIVAIVEKIVKNRKVEHMEQKNAWNSGTCGTVECEEKEN